MKNFALIGLTVALLTTCCLSDETKNECDELKEKELQMTCDLSDFEEYRKCVKERKELRRKRATICPLTGQVVDIDKLSDDTDGPMAPKESLLASDQGLKPVSAPFTVTGGGVFNNTPHWQPQVETVNHNWVVQGEDANFVHNQRYRPARNVTTVIKLTNHINNTNIVNVPTHINATNINNITVFTNSSENFGNFGFGATKEGPCCMVVQPKTCHTGPTGVRCHHKRHKMCNNQCTSRVMHVRSSHHHRQHGVGYVPQPSPSCVYMNQWPFVNCGHRRRDPCDGCYDHYGSYYYQPPPPQSCYGCYDEGFQYGQMYRRGPVMRPHYFHAPPPYYETGYYDMPYDYYGPPPPMYGGVGGDPIIIDDFSNENSTEKKSLEEGDWGVTMQKCKVISDDNTVTLANCTVDNDHPYAAAPNGFPYNSYPYPPYYSFGQRFEPPRHKISPIVSRKSSNEEPPRPIKNEVEEKVEAKEFPEDEEEEDDEKDYENDDE